jgi:hypothetical protein
MVRSVLSRGRAALAAFSAVSSMRSSVSALPRSPEASTETGCDPTPPKTIRASSTVPFSSLATAATERIGKSNAPRRRHFL